MPAFKPVACPLYGYALETSAAVRLLDSQVTYGVTSIVVASENVPLAVNGCCMPMPSVAMPGVTAIDCSVAFVTVTSVEPVTPRYVALMVEVPAVCGESSAYIDTDATAGVPEVHDTWYVSSWVVL